MADWNRYRRQEQRDDQDRGYQDRSYRRDRQHEQFQSDRSNQGDDYGYGQQGEDYARNRFADQYDEIGYRDERSGGSRRDEGSYRNRDRGIGGGSSYGRGGQNPGGLGTFTSDGFRGGGSIDTLDPSYGRGGAAYGRGGYGAGGYDVGNYGAASRQDYGRRDDEERGFFERAGDEVASWFGDEDAARRREIDHRGRGPQNYTRSDTRVLEDACDKLTEDWGVDARNIQVTVQGGEVTLDGTVGDRREKRRAEDVVEKISGVSHVQNNLRTQGGNTRRDNESASGETGKGDRASGTLA